MMAWGAYRFALETAPYAALTNDSIYNWPVQETAGSGPLLQYTGHGANLINLEGLILPEFRGGTGQINQMKLQAELGIGLPLISGQGNFYGLFVAENIKEKQGPEFWPDGTPRRIEFSITFRRYNEIQVSIGGFTVSASGILGAIL